MKKRLIVRRHIKLEQKAPMNLRRQLVASYAANAALDQQLAEDWFVIEQEAFDRARRSPDGGGRSRQA
jgi:hypothetical protein